MTYSVFRSLLLLFASVTSLACHAENGRQAGTITQGRYALPPMLIKNEGQLSSFIKFQVQQPNSSILICDNTLIYQFQTAIPGHDSQKVLPETSSKRLTNVQLQFLGANSDIEYAEGSKSGAYCNYFVGTDSATWRTGLDIMTDVTALDIYPGIDIKYYASKAKFKSDFILHPGSCFTDIKMHYEGVEMIDISQSGELVIHYPGGEIREHIPLAYQESKAGRREISVKYILLDEETVSFQVEEYDPSLDVVIDPVLIFSTFLGGNAGEPWTGPALLRDAAGYLYTAGSTQSSTFPTTAGSYDLSYNGGTYDVFVAKLTPDGSGLVFATFMGGSATDFVGQMELTAVTQDIVIAGMTGGGGFPVTSGAYQTVYAGGQYDVYCAKISNNGTNLIFSTLIGGIDGEQGTSMALDAAGNNWICGYVNTDFPITAGAYQSTPQGGFESFICELNPTGTALLYSTYIGGTGDDRANGIKVDNAGNVYLKGMTTGGFPVTAGAYDQTYNGGANDLFMLKFYPPSNTLVFSTYLGGPAEEWSDQRLSMSPSNEFLVCGKTGSGFPTTAGAYDQTFNGGASDGFVTRLNASGTALIYSTYFGGSLNNDQVTDAKISLGGDLFITGFSGGNIPITGCAFDTTFNGNADAFVCRLNSNASTLISSTYIGGAADDRGCSLWLDGDTIYLLGSTSSANFPVSPGCYDNTPNGFVDYFILKMDLGAGVMPVAAFNANDTICEGQSIAFTNNSSPVGYNSNWVFGDQSTSAQNSPVHVFSSPGTYEVMLIVSNNCGSDTAKATVVVFPFPADIGDTVFMDLGPMISHYPMDGNIQDYSGHNLHGSIFGPVPDTGACTALDDGYRFAANSQYISLPHTPLYNTLPLTISFWFRKNNSSIMITPGPMAEVEGLIFKDWHTGSETPFAYNLLDELPPFRLRFHFGNGTATAFQTLTPNIIQPHEWYHTAGVLWANEGRLYLDGVVQDTAYVTGSISTNTLPILLGKVPNNGEPYRFLFGSMDDLRIYGRALSPCEIKYLASVCSPPILGVEAVDDSLCPGNTASISIINPENNVSYQMLNSLTMQAMGSAVTANCDSVVQLNAIVSGLPVSVKILATNTISGCSTLLDTVLVFNNAPAISIQQSFTVCPGDSVLVNGNYFDQPGTYSDTLQGIEGCDSIVITSLLNFNVIQPDLGPDVAICPGQSHDLNAGAGFVSYLWSTGQTLSSISVNQPATYWVSTTDDNGCHATDTIVLSELPPVSLNLGLDTIVCAGVSVVLDAGPGFNNYIWSNGSGNQVITVTQSGNYSVTVSASGDCGGSDTIHVAFLTGSVPLLPSDTGFCEGATVTLSVINPGVTYLWNTGSTTASVLVFASGWYNVTVTDATGCQSADSTQVTVFPSLVMSVLPPEVVICLDSAVSLQASGASSYAWWPAGGLSSTAGPVVTASPGMTTTYTVSGTASGACPGDTTITVEVIDPPVSTLPDSSIVCEGNSLELDPGPCDDCTYLWSNGSVMPVISITETGSYWVIVRNEGCQVKDDIMVDECFEIWIPNVFTPNGDDKNEFFVAKGVHIDKFRMLIYNRWGEQLFETNDFNKGWDGKFHGRDCPVGVYVYLIDYEGWGTAYTRIKDQRQGIVSLLR